MNLINGKKIRDRILAEIKKGVAPIPFTPLFCDVLVGNDPASAQYVRVKGETAESVGIRFCRADFPASVRTEELVAAIGELNRTKNMCGLIVQLPLPTTVDRRRVLDAVDPRLDVDCLGSASSERFYRGKGGLAFPTALACLEVLNSSGVQLSRKKIVVLGQGELVGRPVAALLRFAGHEPAVVTSDTPDKRDLIRSADIIISGIGRPGYITGDMVKQGAVIIDAGTAESEGGIMGDVDLESVRNVAGLVSPVPGGVGPVTVAMLLRNVLEVAQGMAGRKSA